MKKLNKYVCTFVKVFLASLIGLLAISIGTVLSAIWPPSVLVTIPIFIATLITFLDWSTDPS